MSGEIQELMDRVAIQDVMLKYCRGVDRRSWDLARQAFFDDATDHHADYKGSVQGFFDWIVPIHGQVARSTHFIGNCLIEFGSETVAAVETYFYASLELGPEAKGHRKLLVDGEGGSDARVKTDVLGRYVDRFEKRDGAWRVAARKVVFDSTHSQPVTGSVDLNLHWALGRRDGEDPIFQVRRGAGL